MSNADTWIITTIKLTNETKSRLEKLRIHKRESYDEIVQSMLSLLGLCRANPEKAQRRLIVIERRRRIAERKRLQVESQKKNFDARNEIAQRRR